MPYSPTCVGMISCIVCTNAVRYTSKRVWNKLLHATFLAVVRFVTMILIGKRSRLEGSEMGKQRVPKFESGHIRDPLCQVAFLLEKETDVQQSSSQNTHVWRVADLLRCRTICKPCGRVMRHVSREAVCIG